MILNNKKGFTLIELLVVIAIIGVLSTLAIVALGSARTKARDSKRMSDLKQIATALELYYAENNAYPLDITPGNSLVSPDNLTTYLSKIPSNPTPRTDGTCPDQDYEYTLDSSISYTLTACIGNTINNFVPGPITYTPAGFIASSGSGGSTPWACGDTLDDIRDNQSYATVQIGTQCWMKENLNIGTMVQSQKAFPCTSVAGYWTCHNNDSRIDKYCYNNSASNCTDYGGLYEWQEAMAFSASCVNMDCSDQINNPHQGICPSGWHIPTDDEFKTLEIYLGMSQVDADNTGLRGTDQGTKLKNGGASGFDGIVFGYRRVAFDAIYFTPQILLFWQTNQTNNDTSWVRGLYTTESTVSRYSTYRKPSGLSVRCLKDN